MPLILNLETSTTVCSVALGKDGKLLAFKEINENYTHSENLIPFIEQVLSDTNTNISDLDAIAISKGPGSYTGLRIGVSTAKGLCFALNKPLLAVPTLKAMAKGMQIHSSDLQILLCPMLDARRMEVYCGLYDMDNNEMKETSAQIVNENSFADVLINSKMIFFGDGATKCKPLLAHHKNAVFIDGVFPSAKNMVPLSEELFAEKRLEDVAYFEPFYLKDFVIQKVKN